MLLLCFRPQPECQCIVCVPVPAQPQLQRGLQQRDLDQRGPMCPRQVHGAAGRPQERDGRGPQPGPRDGRQVRVQGRVLAEGEQHHAVLLWQLDRDDAMVQRR